MDLEHPPYLMLRLDSIISPWNREEILAAWDKVQVASPHHLIQREGARSSTPAYHWGVWEATAKKPYITRESREQTPEAIASIDKLLGLVKKLVVPKVIKVTKEYLPDQWIRQERLVYIMSIPKALYLPVKNFRAYKRVQVWLGKELALRPALDFHGAFFTVAVKEGVSEKIHIDFNDGKNTITWIWAVGDWEGAEFVAPQVGIQVPVRPGQVFGMMARVLAHFTTPKKSGRRVIFTCFTEQLLWSHTNLPPVIIC